MATFPLSTSNYDLVPLNQSHKTLYVSLYTNIQVMNFIGKPANKIQAETYFKKAHKASNKKDNTYYIWLSLIHI